MALRLSRDLSNKPSNTPDNTNQTGLVVSGLDGKTYDLDEIEKLRNRSGTTGLFVEVKENTPTENLGNLNAVQNSGDLLVGTGVKLKPTTDSDYKTYLINSNCGLTKTNSYYVPDITNKHPVVIWNDETIDTVHTEIGEQSLVYSKLYELEKVYDTVNNNFAILLSDENRPLLEAVSGVRDILERLDSSMLDKTVANDMDNPSENSIPTTAAIAENYVKKEDIVLDIVDNIDEYSWDGQVSAGAILAFNSTFVRNSDGENTYTMVIS